MKPNRKDWIKNITIIFLAIMLVLTFFSNTIMNYSLPEVATAMIEPGTVTTKIRGTGTLEADDPYKITVQESRVIASVAVKEGDVVEKDQVLFYLEDKESTELKEAEKKLDEMVLAYTTTLLAGEISQQSYENIQRGTISSSGSYQARINEAKLKVENAQATVDSLAKQIAIAGTGNSGNTDKEAALKNAETAKSQAADRLSQAQTRLDEAKEAAGTESTGSLQANLNMAVGEEGTKKAVFDDAELAFFTLVDTTTGGDRAKADEYLKKMVSEKDTYMGTLGKEIEEMTDGDQPSAILDENGVALKKKDAAVKLLQDLQEAYKNYLTAQTARQAAEQALKNQSGQANELNAAQTEYNNAKNHYEECNALVQSLTNEINNNTANATKQKADLDKAKIEADAALETAKKELTQLLTDVGKELNLSSQSSAIREQQEEVARLREKSMGSTIVAPVAGTVNSISKTAGETTVPDEAIAMMQPEGKGYTMSFSVTNEQAKKVSVGEVAELQNAWYYGDVTATLTGIRPDTQNPGQKKLLQFSVTGEVQPGQSISLSIGQKSANYDMIVPNSAVREDSNGKFILIVESRNSPLGNRYIATRVDVEVLASDDLNTAVSAALYGYEYVITTANKPVEAGKQVRLADE